MINNSRLKTLSLIFAILSAIALVVCLVMAITLPSVSVYDTVFGTVRATRPGTFDMHQSSFLPWEPSGASAFSAPLRSAAESIIAIRKKQKTV